MRVGTVAAVILAGVVGVGCTVSHGRGIDGLKSGLVPAGPPLDEPAETEKVESEQELPLWDTDLEVLKSAMRQFLLSHGTTPNPHFASLKKVKDDEIQFASVPAGWFTWKDIFPAGQVIVHDQDGFRILVKIDQDDPPAWGRQYSWSDTVAVGGGKPVPREVGCYKLKGDTNFNECRYIRTPQGSIKVTLHVWDEPRGGRTLSHLFALLREHYGEYEGVCQRVQEFVPSQ